MKNVQLEKVEGVGLKAKNDEREREGGEYRKNTSTLKLSAGRD
jgi:hypothetical protein